MRSLFPRISWDLLSSAEALQLDLSLHERWQGLCIEWFGRGVIVFVRRVRG